MEKLIITGGTPLKGEVVISGAKNAAVAIIPATLLINGVCRIDNLPNISDVKLYCNILENMGANILEVVNMGRRELAYEINTFKNGSYFLIKLEGEPAAVKEFDRVANISEDIIRHIVVKREK